MAIIKHADLEKIRKRFRDKTIVYCSGSFDLPHLGHILHLNYCKKLGDILVVNVGPDSDIKKNKGGGRPILSQKIRLKTLDFLKPVDFVFLGKAFKDGEHPFFHLAEVLKKLAPDLYVINRDSGHIIPQIRKVARQFKIKLVVAGRKFPKEFRDVSTTKIVKKIKKLKH